MGGVELDVVDRALLVLEAAERVDQGFGRRGAGGQRAGDLPAQRHTALLGDIALLGVAELTQHLAEFRRIEIAGGALEIRIAEDGAHGFGVGLREPLAPGVLVQRGLGHRLLQHLTIDAEGARLVGRQRLAELAADLLQPLGIELPELLSADFGAADLGCRRSPKALEDVGDTPDGEGQDQHAHHRGHDGLADPIR